MGQRTILDQEGANETTTEDLLPWNVHLELPLVEDGRTGAKRTSTASSNIDVAHVMPRHQLHPKCAGRANEPIQRSNGL